MSVSDRSKVEAGSENRAVSVPTSALFTYQRDDNTPDSTTTIQIDVTKKASSPIHPYLFGNFIEHLGGVVYPGLWANLILNPGLEAIETDKSKHAGIIQNGLPEWNVNSLALIRSSKKPLKGYLSSGYVTLLSPQPQSLESGLISQTIYPPVHRTLRYSGSIYLRLNDPVEPVAAGKKREGLVAISLNRRGGNEAKPLVEVRLTVTGTRWTRRQFTLMLPPDSAVKGQGVDFVVRYQGGEPVDIDRIELFPDDNVAGVDTDVLKKARDWGIPLMRWPGGNFASGYHWPDGIGNRESRPTLRNDAWGGLESNEFGTDEFMKFCHNLGTTPQMTVNAGNGTPEEAAEWVRYCNGNASEKFGKKRATNGHPQPYSIRLWEIGNELYGDWQIGHTVPDENAARYVRFRDAMLRADSQLSIIATGKGDEYTPDGLVRNDRWNEALLSAAIMDGRTPPDYISIHPLVPLPGGLDKYSYAEQYESAMAHPAFLDRTLLPDLAARIHKITGSKSHTKIAVTEWGIIIGGNRWQESPNHDSLAGAIYNSLCLNAMLRNSDLVTLANMTAFMHGGGIKKPGGVVTVDPQYWTQKLYAQAEMHTPVAVHTTGPGSSVPARGFLPAVRDVPDIDVFAALDKTGKKLIVSVVNRHLTKSRQVQMNVSGFSTSSVTSEILTASDPRAQNTLSAPDMVKPNLLRIEHETSGNGLRVTLPPHSSAMITLL